MYSEKYSDRELIQSHFNLTGESLLRLGEEMLTLSATKLTQI